LPDRFLRADTDAGALFACVSPGCKFVVPQVGTIRLTAALHPYPNEETARTALLAAGGRAAEWEGKR